MMDPITFGMVAISTAGGSLLIIAILEAYGIELNTTAINIALEVTKYGGMLYLLKHLSKIFL